MCTLQQAVLLVQVLLLLLLLVLHQLACLLTVMAGMCMVPGLLCWCLTCTTSLPLRHQMQQQQQGHR